MLKNARFLPENSKKMWDFWQRNSKNHNFLQNSAKVSVLDIENLLPSKNLLSPRDNWWLWNWTYKIWVSKSCRYWLNITEYYRSVQYHSKKKKNKICKLIWYVLTLQRSWNSQKGGNVSCSSSMRIWRRKNCNFLKD